MSSDKLVLQSAKFVEIAAKVARQKYDTQVVGAEMLKHGYALLFGLSLETASAQVQEMFADHDRKIASALMERADTSRRN